MVNFLRKHTRETIIIGAAALGLSAALELVSGLILNRLIIDPAVGIGVITFAWTFFIIAWLGMARRGFERKPVEPLNGDVKL